MDWLVLETSGRFQGFPVGSRSFKIPDFLPNTIVPRLSKQILAGQFYQIFFRIESILGMFLQLLESFEQRYMTNQ